MNAPALDAQVAARLQAALADLASGRADRSSVEKALHAIGRDAQASGSGMADVVAAFSEAATSAIETARRSQREPPMQSSRFVSSLGSSGFEGDETNGARRRSIFQSRRRRSSAASASKTTGAPAPAEHPLVRKQVVPAPPLSPQTPVPPSAGRSLQPPVEHS